MQYTLLYEFSIGAKVWRYTANAEDVVDPNGNVWEAASISDEGVSTSGSTTADSLTINSSIDIVPARLWMHSRPSKVMDVRILRADLPARVEQGDDTGLDNTPDPRLIPVTNLRVHYVGEVAQCSFGVPGSASFLCETIAATMQREGLRLTWQRACPYVIYDPLTCKVDKSSFAVNNVVEAIAGNQVTLASPISGNFSGGMLEYVHPLRGQDTMAIDLLVGSVLVVIFEGAEDLYVGQEVTLYPSCNQTPASCVSFGNKPNYGGIEALPGKSPFNGIDGPVF